VDGGRVVLGQVIRKEAARVEAFDLEKALTIDPIEAQTRHRLDMVEDPEAEAHR
jgi:hypothetical protein